MKPEVFLYRYPLTSKALFLVIFYKVIQTLDYVLPKDGALIRYKLSIKSSKSPMRSKRGCGQNPTRAARNTDDWHRAAVPCGAVMAGIRGVEPSVERSAADPRIAAYAFGVIQLSRERGLHYARITTVRSRAFDVG
jgi:hypothetical protein